MRRWRGWGIAVGYAADLAFGDPQRFHPVAGFGQVAARFEQRTYARSRSAGAIHVAALVGGVAVVGWGAERSVRDRGWAEVALTAGATWCVLGGRSLYAEAEQVEHHLLASDLVSARRQVARLVGRVTSELTTQDVARATVESVAENTSDAVVAPLLWVSVGGVSGALAYRAINTLDAMIGHRSNRYLEFGWAAARLDDLANLLPSRIAALLAACAAQTVAGRPLQVLNTWQRDAHEHPSPNAGPVEAAFAGALGVQLGGINAYGDAVEHRGVLGSGGRPGAGDIGRAVRLARVVSLLAAGAATGLAWVSAH